MKSNGLHGVVSSVETLKRDYKVEFGEYTKSDSWVVNTQVFDSKGLLVCEQYRYVAGSKDFEDERRFREPIYKSAPVNYEGVGGSTPTLKLDSLYRFYHYNSNAQITTINTYKSDGTLFFLDEFVYQDNKIKEHNIYKWGNDLTFKTTYKYEAENQVTVKKYGTDGHQTDYGTTYTIVNGDVVKEQTIYTTRYTYQNHLMMSRAGSKDHQTVYAYDKWGNMTKKGEKVYNYNTKQFQLNDRETVRWKYTYDQQGNWIWKCKYSGKWNEETTEDLSNTPASERTIQYGDSEADVDVIANRYLQKEQDLIAQYKKEHSQGE
ncbi:MAG: hypothetical protein IJ635_00935 [Bacteroidaceae bacterium]|nr:hypothetical protein [Bacteroidaceae bacterium]